jgi:hypothetical protein
VPTSSVPTQVSAEPEAQPLADPEPDDDTKPRRRRRRSSASA